MYTRMCVCKRVNFYTRLLVWLIVVIADIQDVSDNGVKGTVVSADKNFIYFIL